MFTRIRSWVLVWDSGHGDFCDDVGLVIGQKTERTRRFVLVEFPGHSRWFPLADCQAVR